MNRLASIHRRVQSPKLVGPEDLELCGAAAQTPKPEPHSTGKTTTKLLRLAEVTERTGLGKTKIYELQKVGRFPMRVRVTSTAVRWVDSEVEAWVAEQVQARLTA